MNWKRLYATVQTAFTVCAAALLAAIFWGMLITGAMRFVFKLDENPAMLFVFCPSALLIFSVCVRKLPPSLRKTGMLSDEPESFGPWFK